VWKRIGFALLSVVLVAPSMIAATGGAAPRSGGGRPYESVTTVPLRLLRTTPPLSSLSGARGSRGNGQESPAAARDRLRPRIGAGGQVRTVEPPVSDPPSARDNARVSSHTPGMKRSWEGLDSFDTAWANSGNAFFLEPPDQGLCVGPDHVLETVNSVVQVYTPAGRPLLPGNPGIPGTKPVGISHNEWFGFPPAFDRPAERFGPFTTDPSCYYDRQLRRWFHVVLTIAQEPVSGEFTGRNSIDLAVSRSADPLGRWDIYRLPVQNDGTDGSPDHGCDAGPCIGDYPHIGLDRHGLYITTNEYSFFGDGYTGAQLYALPKAALAAGDATEAVLFENLRVPSLDQRGFTVRPAWSRASSFEGARGGTEYFVSSTAGDGSETGNMTGESNDMVVWALTNTSSLKRATPDLELHQVVKQTIEYQFPPLSLQKEGPTPLLRCLNLGADCIFEEDLGHQPGPYPLDSGDTRVTSSFMASGVLWTSLTTALQGSGGADYDSRDGSFRPIRQRAGVAYFAFRPWWDGGTLKARLLQDGYVAVAGGNITYPSLAVNEKNRGYIGVSLVGPSQFPSAAYIPIALKRTPDVVHVAAPGRAPSDGFTGTVFGGFRPRWQDYGYMVPGNGDDLWFGVEYIDAKCGFAAWLDDPNCGDERTLFTNWSTRVTKLEP
jgi:hypothetical protein